jgi:hypothetical protein
VTDRGRWVWLDDVRREPVGWERAKTVTECIELLKRGGVDIVSLDHDLAEEQEGIVWEDASHHEPTGYDVALWLEEQAHLGCWTLVPGDLRCHSANPSGKARILLCFASIARMREVWGT